MQNLSSRFWLISLRIMSSRCIRVVACYRISCPLHITERYSSVYVYVCMYVCVCVCVCVCVYDTICLAIHPAMDIFIVSTFWPPWILLLWTSICASPWLQLFRPYNKELKCRITCEFYSLFVFLQNYQTVFSADAVLYFHQQHIKIPISLHSHQVHQNL